MNYWEISELDVPKLFNADLLLLNVTAKPVNFSFCMMQNLNSDKVTYLGFPDIYILRTSAPKGEVPRVVEFKNSKLNAALREHVFGSILAHVPEKERDFNSVVAFLYAIYAERWNSITSSVFGSEAYISQLKNDFDKEGKWFTKSDYSYLAFEVGDFGYVVFELNEGLDNIELKEFLIFKSSNVAIGYDVEPQMQGCP